MVRFSLFQHINGNILDDSVRVSGQGNAVIHEVKVEYRQATEKEKACPEVRLLVRLLDPKEM